MKLLRVISLVFLFIGIAHVANLAFWYFLVGRDISEIPLYREHLTTVAVLIYFTLSLVRDLMMKFSSRRQEG